MLLVGSGNGMENTDSISDSSNLSSLGLNPSKSGKALISPSIEKMSDVSAGPGVFPVRGEPTAVDPVALVRAKYSLTLEVFIVVGGLPGSAVDGVGL